MRTGNVVFHGEISELREQAPEQGHRITTDDDERALELATAHDDLAVEPAPDGGLVATGPQDAVDAYVSLLTALVTDDIFASEDQHGTWKTVPTLSAGRGQQFWAKTITALTFAIGVLIVRSRARSSPACSQAKLLGHDGVTVQSLNAPRNL
jgi:hypothetical protein